MSITSGIKLAPLLVNLKTDLSGLKSGLAEAGTLGSNTASSISAKFADIGKQVGTVGKNLSLYFTAPLVGLGTTALNTASNFESAMSNVKAISGATGEDLKMLEEKAMEMGAKTSKSATDSANALSYMALAGWNTTEMMEGLEPILRLAEAGNTDLARTSDLVTDSMSALGLKTNELKRYLDICAKAQNTSNTTANAMLEAYINCGGTMKNLNVSLEESATWLGVLANRGIKGSEAGNALNSVLVNLTGGSSSARGAMEELGVSAWDANGNFIGIEETLRLLSKALANCTKEQETNFESAIGGKTRLTELQALISGLGEEYADLKGKITDSDGALLTMAETMQDNLNGKVTILKSALEGLAIKLGNVLIPMIQDVVEKITVWVDKFSSLDESTQESIVKVGMFVAALGPILVVGGKVFTLLGTLTKGIGLIGTAAKTAAGIGGLSGVGSFAGSLVSLSGIALPLIGTIAAVGAGIYAIGEHSEYMNTKMNTSSEELSWIQRKFNDLNGNVIKSKDELVELGLVYEDWSDNISPEVQKQLEETSKKIRDLNTEIMNHSDAGLKEIITENDVNNIKSKTKELCDGVISTLNSNKEEVNGALAELFNADGELSVYEKNTISYLNRTYDEASAKVKEYEDKIYEIIEKANQEKRSLYTSEEAIVKQYYEEIGKIKLEALARNNEDLQREQANFITRCNNLDLQGASDLLVEKAKIRDENIANIKENYDTEIQMLKMNLNNANDSERIAIQENIRQLEKKRDEAVGIEKDQYAKYLEVLRQRYPKILNEINKSNGEILTAEENKKLSSIQKISEMYDNIENITESGEYDIYNTKTKAFERLIVKVDEATGEIVGIHRTSTNETIALNNEVKTSLDGEAEKYYETSDKVIDSIRKASASNTSYTAETRQQIDDIISKMTGIDQKADGTATAIITLNGHKIDVKVNKDGTISNLDEITSKMNLIDGRELSVHVGVYEDYYSDGRGNVWGGGRWLSGGGTHYNGLNYVPFDGYTATLHKGERVLTAKENKEYIQQGGNTTNNNGITLNIQNFTNNRKQDIKALAEELEFYRKQIKGGIS